MGCSNSKLDDLPALALCRDRCLFLDEAIRQRYLLSQAHLAYTHSLQYLGASLHAFFLHHLDNFSSASPLLNASSPPPPHHRSHSDSDDDSDDDDHPLHHDDTSADSGSLHHHSRGHSSPLHHQYTHLGGFPRTERFGLGFPDADGYAGGTFVHMNFMRNQMAPSVTFQQRPITPQIVRMDGEASTSSSSYPYPYPPPQNIDPSFYPPFFNYSNYGGSGFPGSSPPRATTMPYYASSSAPPVGGFSSLSASTSEEPPPLPSPPRASAWEFFNPFENFDNFYPPYAPSPNSREVREEEGIPDLEEEEEDYQQEVVKKVPGNHKFVDGSSRGAGGGHVEGGRGNNSEALYEVHVVDKKAVNGEESVRPDVAGFKTRGAAFKGDSEVVREIQVQFERASESGNELAKILEVGKLPYNRKHAAYQAPSKMLHAIAPSLSVVSSRPSTSKTADVEKADPVLLDAEGELNLRSRNLSSTLQKLYLWEKKLYEEVKVEEKMRILHERKCQKLKQLDERGAEPHKVDATRAIVRSLSTKIRIAIEVVDKISVKINRLRDDELWPQLHEFIQGLVRMWKSMLECHHNQCQAIVAAKHLDAIASREDSSDAHIEVTSQLERDVINWTVGFSCWIGAQKGYVRALNNWLMKCLLYVPEETPDGMAPFSPGRMGAPPVFVICNQWSQAFDRVSEKEVLDTMRDFASSVHHLWEHDKLEVRGMTANKNMERKIKNLEREDQKLQKQIPALDNSLSLSGKDVYQSDTSKSTGLQVGLQRIFEAMERFAANSLKVHEELQQRIEGDRARDPGEVS